MFNKPLLALSITAAITSTAFAQEEFRQHEAHVHGHVELNIAQDGHELLMEITAPGADVVGFEHAPQNEDQKARLTKALNSLNNAESIFTLTSAANCHQEQTFVTHTLGDEHGHDEHHDHDDHAEHDHDEHHDHDSHAEHDHDEHHDHDSHAEHDHDEHHDHDSHAEHDHDEHHDHEHEEGSQHGSFTAQYTFHCDDISQLSSIDTSWFTHFPSTKEIDVNLLTDKQQTALELNPGKTEISL